MKTESKLKKGDEMVTKLLGFVFEVQHICGSNKVLADTLSRYPVPFEGPDDQDRETIMNMQLYDITGGPQ